MYRLSNHSVHNINYHIVFCPKRRKAVLIDDLAKDLDEIIHRVCKKLNIGLEKYSIMPDHVHLFVSCPPNIPPHQIIKEIKGISSKELRKVYPTLQKLPAMWSRSYYVGSVGFVSESVVKNYIDNQKGK